MHRPRESFDGQVLPLVSEVDVQCDISGRVLFGNFEDDTFVLSNGVCMNNVSTPDFRNGRMLRFIRRILLAVCGDYLHERSRIIFFKVVADRNALIFVKWRRTEPVRWNFDVPSSLVSKSKRNNSAFFV